MNGSITEFEDVEEVNKEIDGGIKKHHFTRVSALL